jgi:hypothetical protein
VRFVSGTVLTLAGIPTLSSAQYNLILTNGNSGMSATFGNAINADSVLSPQSIFGPPLIIEAMGDQPTCPSMPCTNGANVNGFVDLALRGNIPVQATGGSQGTWTQADSVAGNRGTVIMNGTSDSYQTTSNVVYDTGNAKTLWMAAVHYQTSISGRSPVFRTLTATLETASGAGKCTVRDPGGTTTVTYGTTTAPNTLVWEYGYNQSTGTNTENYGINVSTTTSFGAEVTASGTNTSPVVGTATIGFNNIASFYTGHTALILGVDVIPTTTQDNEFAQWASAYYTIAPNWYLLSPFEKTESTLPFVGLLALAGALRRRRAVNDNATAEAAKEAA